MAQKREWIKKPPSCQHFKFVFQKPGGFRKYIFMELWGWGCTSTLAAHGYWSHTIPVMHDDIIKWKHFLRYWPFTMGIHRSPVDSSHKSQWPGAFMVSLIYAWTNGRANARDADNLRRHRTFYDVTVMVFLNLLIPGSFCNVTTSSALRNWFQHITNQIICLSRDFNLLII